MDTRVANSLRLVAEILCKHGGGHLAKAGVTPLAMVKAFEVFPYRSVGLRTGFLAPGMHPFVFQTAPEALQRSVVVTIPLAGQGGRQPLWLQSARVIPGAVLTASV